MENDMKTLKAYKKELKEKYQDQINGVGIGDDEIILYVSDEATKNSMPSEYKGVSLNVQVADISIQ